MTLDELADRAAGRPGVYDLTMTARVNGAERSRGNLAEIHYSFGDMIARASAGVDLEPGDLIGSGTVGTGCLLELTHGEGPWLQPGDVVELEVERLGILRNTVMGADPPLPGEARDASPQGEEAEMPFYHRMGETPKHRHTQFRRADGGLYREEVMGLEGFSGIQSILYHHFLPPRLVRSEDLGLARPAYTEFGPLRHRAYATAELPAGGDPVSARRVLLGNADVTLGVSRPTQSMEYYYRNAQAYEVWFAHEGSGALHTQFGRLTFGPGDYLVIPYGTTWRMELSGPGAFLHHRGPVADRPSPPLP